MNLETLEFRLRNLEQIVLDQQSDLNALTGNDDAHSAPSPNGYLKEKAERLKRIENDENV